MITSILSVWILTVVPELSTFGQDEWRKVIDPPVTSNLYILQPHLDLRALFCSQQSILDHEKRLVICTQNFFGGDPREFPVAKNDTLGTLFNLIGGTNYGYRTQFRLIQKDAVSQCRWMGKDPISENWKKFLSTKIEPGDIIVICPRDDFMK